MASSTNEDDAISPPRRRIIKAKRPPKMTTTTSKEEELISEMLSQQKIDDLSINDTDVLTIICANCGKEVSNINICNKCKAATYCNAACKKKHRSKHKQECERRVAELREEVLERERRAAELRDEKLFKKPPPNEDCPICMLPLPVSLDTGSKYKSCCGKIICSGCIHAVEERDGGVGLCPFCRSPTLDSEEQLIEQYKIRAELGDADAICNLGCWYSEGLYGLPQDHAKALELWHQAAELGNTFAYYNIGCAYYGGDGVERDEKKAAHYCELAAMKGCAEARHNLGALEGRAGNTERALKHLMIAAGAGYIVALETIKLMFMDGDATKEDYAKALRAYQSSLVAIKSAQRDEAAAISDDFKYY